METILVILLITSPSLLDLITDPSHAVLLGRQELRNLDCQRMTQQRAHELYPGRVPEPPPRMMALENVDALICRPRIMEPGERAPRDEVILSSLRQSVGEIIDVAGALGGDDTVWHVDAFYPDARVASKISSAARTSLAESKRQVSEKVPLLAAGDLVVLRDMPPEKAYPLACQRYFAEKALGANDGFLAIMLLDARETQLHAGVCLGGAWRWLR